MTAAALLNTVRAHGLRVSSARRNVLDALLNADQPLTAEEIAAGADIASTYRNLDALETIGIVRHVHLGHGPGRYALAMRSGGWATCETCGRSTALEPDALRPHPSGRVGGVGVRRELRSFPDRRPLP